MVSVLLVVRSQRKCLVVVTSKHTPFHTVRIFANNWAGRRKKRSTRNTTPPTTAPPTTAATAHMVVLDLLRPWVVYTLVARMVEARMGTRSIIKSVSTGARVVEAEAPAAALATLIRPARLVRSYHGYDEMIWDKQWGVWRWRDINQTFPSPKCCSYRCVSESG